jgi:hypothetical protein
MPNDERDQSHSPEARHPRSLTTNEAFFETLIANADTHGWQELAERFRKQDAKGRYELRSDDIRRLDSVTRATLRAIEKVRRLAVAEERPRNRNPALLVADTRLQTREERMVVNDAYAATLKLLGVDEQRRADSGRLAGLNVSTHTMTTAFGLTIEEISIGSDEGEGGHMEVIATWEPLPPPVSPFRHDTDPPGPAAA